MKKIEKIVEPFINAEDTCIEVENYFKKGNKPTGPYIDLAEYFKDENYKHGNRPTKSDREFKTWMIEMVNNMFDYEADNRDNQSIVLSVLKQRYNTKEKLIYFVFSINGIDPKLNQKWHFFIAYWSYREFVAKNMDKNTDRLTLLTVDKDEYMAGIENPFKYCEEGSKWFDCMKNKNNIELK